MKMNNVDGVADSFIWQDSIGLITKSLGACAGSQKFYVNIDSVPPNAFSTKYHSHSQQEEFFMILDGNGTLRINDDYIAVKKGDFFSKPGGQNIAHTFINSGNAALVILDIGSVESEDTCYYPDEDIFLHKLNGEAQVYKKGDLMNEWVPSPNGL